LAISIKQASGRAAVVGADKADIAQRIVGLVVRGEDDHAVFFAGKAHDEVAHGHRADGRVGGEGVFFKLVVLELVAQELFRLGMAGTQAPARPDGHELARNFDCAIAAEMLLCEGCRGQQDKQKNKEKWVPHVSFLRPGSFSPISKRLLHHTAAFFLALPVRMHPPRHADADEIEQQHGHRKGELRGDVRRRRDDLDDDEDDQDGVAEVLPQERGLTMPNMARKKITTGISKTAPMPRISEMKKLVYSSMLMMG
jgi:hypothetical protein